MHKKATVTSIGNDETLEVESLPVNESEADTDADADAYDDSDEDDDDADSDSADDDVEFEATPIFIETKARSNNHDNYQDPKILALKIIELEDKFANLEIQLNTLVSNQRRKKGKTKRIK